MGRLTCQFPHVTLNHVAHYCMPHKLDRVFGAMSDPTRRAIIGRLARLQAVLHSAANEKSDEKFLAALAGIAAFARIGGEGVGDS